MSLPWTTRKARLGSLLDSHGDEDADALTLDRILHGQKVIGKTSKTIEIDTLRFTDRDLDVVGTLEYGQFGVIDVVTCHLDSRVYVRKSIESRFALKARDQCSPQIERDILLQATKTYSHWAPRLLCAFQSPTHLNLIMDYVEGGTLWDVLESSPHDGKVPESDLKWWVPQIISAIHWCHSQGFAHRDIKPHNFVLTPTAHILLIDFGSAAPLLPPRKDGSQQIPKRFCLVPCGTCDYISPEILQAHEEALVALEMTADDKDMRVGGSIAGVGDEHNETGGYGRETDWWSLGAMLYEMAYGVAPFFANDIRQTYLRIMDHATSLRFPMSPLSAAYEDLIRRLLTNCDERLGRRSFKELTQHIFFEDTDWRDFHAQSAPPGLHLPLFTYTTPTELVDDGRAPKPENLPSTNDTYSQPFAFSVLFQSSRDSSPGLSALHSTPSQNLNRSAIREQAVSSFIGFSWGPKVDAFPSIDSHHVSPPTIDTPRPLGLRSTQSTPYLKLHHSTQPYATPLRPVPHTLPRTSTVRRRNTAQRRAVSGREAMKQLVDCVGMSARKKVMESGRKPRVLTLPPGWPGGLKKDVRFGPPPQPAISAGDYDESYAAESSYRRDTQVVEYPAESDYTESEGPPSPSPRPGSAMSVISKRSGTPTISASYSQRLSNTVTGSSTSMLLKPPVATHKRDQNVSANDIEPVSDQAFNTGILDALDKKHASIMGDIEDIEQRLDYLLTEVDG